MKGIGESWAEIFRKYWDGTPGFPYEARITLAMDACHRVKWMRAGNELKDRLGRDQ
jgi:hypothetical protein